MPFPLFPPKVKYLRINITKYIQDLYEENYKTLMKEIKELNKWRDTPCAWIVIIVKLIYRFSIIPVKILLSYFVDRNKWILKFIYSLAKDPE